MCHVLRNQIEFVYLFNLGCVLWADAKKIDPKLTWVYPLAIAIMDINLFSIYMNIFW